MTILPPAPHSFGERLSVHADILADVDLREKQRLAREVAASMLPALYDEDELELDRRIGDHLREPCRNFRGDPERG